MGAVIDSASVDRLTALGLDRDEVEALGLREAAVEFPEGWRERDNRLYAAPGVTVHPDFVTARSAFAGASGCLVVLASPVDALAAFGVHGDGATVFVGPECWLPSAQLDCGANSSIVLRRRTTCAFAGQVDARNGGAVFADVDQLWASHVYLATDDMHTLLDAASGARINPFGARIALGRHVWLERDVAVAGGADIGDDCVVGFRSLVRAGSYPAGSVLAGLPARVVKSGVTWDRADVETGGGAS